MIDYEGQPGADVNLAPIGRATWVGMVLLLTLAAGLIFYWANWWMTV